MKYRKGPNLNRIKFFQIKYKNQENKKLIDFQKSIKQVQKIGKIILRFSNKKNLMSVQRIKAPVAEEYINYLIKY